MKTSKQKGLGARNPAIAAFCMLFLAIAVSAQTQTPAPAQQNPQSQINIDEIVSRPIPIRTLGLEPGKVVPLSLRDTILLALEKNVDIELERENVRLAQYDVFAAQGFYDPIASSEILYQSSINPASFRSTGLDVDRTNVTNKQISYNFGLRKQIERFGSDFRVDFNNQRTSLNTSTLPLAYRPSLTFSFTQPLFRNFKIDGPRQQIKIAKKRLDLSDALFRQRAIEIITGVTAAYWDLALAIKNESVARASVTLAETQLNQNKRQVEVGTLAPIEVVSAATALEQRRQQVFQEMQQVAAAENALKAMIVDGPASDLWKARIDPTEKFEVQTPINLPLDDAIKLAKENRPEIKRLLLEKDINQVNIDFYRNQAKPQIDFVSFYLTNSTAGTPITSLIGNCGSPVIVGTDPFCLSTNGVTQVNGVNVPVVGLTPFTQSPQTSASGQFAGGYGTALKNLFKNDFRTWQVGLQINFPLRNRTAQANLGRAKEQERQLDLTTRKLLQGIEVEVRNGVQAVETAKMQIEASKLQRRYAEQQLEGEVKKFQAGMGGTFFVLQRQTELSQAQVAEQSALAGYNIAVARLYQIISTTLANNSIEIKSEVQPIK
ncbi:MAG: TolC family protein [Acidobacteria bacterium]|nr:TolC family protein [Acidobacteriota bacterium]